MKTILKILVAVAMAFLACNYTFAQKKYAYIYTGTTTLVQRVGIRVYVNDKELVKIGEGDVWSGELGEFSKCKLTFKSATYLTNKTITIDFNSKDVAFVRVVLEDLAWSVNEEFYPNVPTQVKDAYDQQVGRTQMPKSVSMWEQAIDEDDSNILETLENNKILVGMMDVNRAGMPEENTLTVLDSKSGQTIWSVQRAKLSSTFMSDVLMTDPVILIASQGDPFFKLQCFDRTTGKMNWEIVSKESVMPIVDRNLIFLIKRSKLESIDFNTGKTIWSKSIEEDLFPKDRQLSAIVASSLVLVGNYVQLIDVNNGNMTAKIPLRNEFSNELGLRLINNDLLIWSGSCISIIDLSQQKIRLEKFDNLNTNINVLWHDDILLRAYNNGQGNSNVEIESLNQQSAKLHWRQKIKGPIVSPLYINNGKLFFSSDSAVFAIDLHDGQIEWATKFERAFASAAPSKVLESGQPDIFKFLDKKVVVSRELFGVSCFDSNNGGLLWSQQNLNSTVGSNPYYLSTLKLLLNISMAQNKMTNNDQEKKPINYFNYEKNTNAINPILESSQRRYDYTMARTKVTLSNQRTSQFERQIAMEERRTAIGFQTLSLKTSQSFSQAQAAIGFAGAATGSIAAAKEQQQYWAKINMVRRIDIRTTSSINARRNSFQGKYHLQPFMRNGLGVTVVNLETGTRNDLIYSPYIESLDLYGVDLPEFIITSDGSEDFLITVGIGLDKEKHQMQKKYGKFMQPKPSIQCYRLDDLNFDESSELVRQSVSEKNKMDSAYVIGLKAAQEMYEEVAKVPKEETEMIVALVSNDMKKVKTLLENSPDQQQLASYGMIGAASLGKNDAIELFLNNGANINHLSSEGVSALMIAVRMGQVKTVQFLLSKKADKYLKAPDGKTAIDFTNEIKDSKTRKQVEQIIEKN